MHIYISVPSEYILSLIVVIMAVWCVGDHKKCFYCFILHSGKIVKKIQKYKLSKKVWWKSSSLWKKQKQKKQWYRHPTKSVDLEGDKCHLDLFPAAEPQNTVSVHPGVHTPSGWIDKRQFKTETAHSSRLNGKICTAKDGGSVMQETTSETFSFTQLQNYVY